MILSASRRTDIPAFYSAWMMRRLEEGFVLVPNPRNPKRLGRVALSPDSVDCIVFWSKNPAPMLDKLDAIGRMGYRFYFEFTVTPYGEALEPGLPPLAARIDTFRRLSDILGPERVDWRCDPIMMNTNFPASWHRDRFGELCAALADSTRRCILSFIDVYPHLKKRLTGMNETEMRAIARDFSNIARQFDLPLFTCAEEIDLSEWDIGHASCIDGEKIGRIAGYPVAAKKDPGQRAACGCIESVDIGVYDTCSHGCVYCYATTSASAVTRRTQAHDPDSPMLTGCPSGDEIITDRTRPSCRTTQLLLPGMHAGEIRELRSPGS